MNRKAELTKGQIEAAISDALTSFEKEYMGRGPVETKTYVVNDMLITRLKGMLTKAEMKLVKSEKDSRGRSLIKQVRNELVENERPALEAIIRRTTRCKVKSLHTDISTLTGERIFVFVLDRKPFIRRIQ